MSKAKPFEALTNPCVNLEPGFVVTPVDVSRVMAMLGARGGAAKTARKAAASRANGAKRKKAT